MVDHFEELWEKCEIFHKEAALGSPVQNVLEELMIKINLYKAIDSKTEIPEEERQKLKSRTLGEILLTFTNLSLKDNINVYEALSIALQYRTLDHANRKFKP
jgi:hypothetical protein